MNAPSLVGRGVSGGASRLDLGGKRRSLRGVVHHIRSMGGSTRYVMTSFLLIPRRCSCRDLRRLAQINPKLRTRGASLLRGRIATAPACARSVHCRRASWEMMFEDATGLSQKRGVKAENASTHHTTRLCKSDPGWTSGGIGRLHLRTAILDRLSGPLSEAIFLSMPALEVTSPGIARSRRQLAGLRPKACLNSLHRCA
jgi:hypothetical protein